MAWFKVDDALAFNMKAVAAGNNALGLWVRAGSWSCQQLTDGFVPESMIAALGGNVDDAHALAESGMWHPKKGGWVFHDWAEYQESSEKVKERRVAARDRMKAARDKRSQNVRANEQRTTRERSPYPDPTRPDPTRPTSSNEEVPGEGSHSALSPFCKRHPIGTDNPCRACKKAATDYEAAQPRITPTRPRYGANTDPMCTTHPGYPIPCIRCAEEMET